jgi:hypothetical protein
MNSHEQLLFQGLGDGEPLRRALMYWLAGIFGLCATAQQLALSGPSRSMLRQQRQQF